MDPSQEDGPKLTMKYNGSRVTPTYVVDRIDPDSITPQEFHRLYVMQRRPVIFTRFIPGFNIEDWTFDRLRSCSGQELVKVERKAKSGNFGSGLPRKTMYFSDLLDKIENSSPTDESKYYLTTQYTDIDEEDLFGYNETYHLLSEYCPQPLPAMLDYFPYRPELLGHLAPQQVNLWVGSSPSGSSSGLHHDFHDNLYLLIRGRKSFTLFSPADAPNLYTYGKIKIVFPNGLILYDDADPIRPDGVPLLDAASHKVEVLEAQITELSSKTDDQSKILLEELTVKRLAAQDEVLDLMRAEGTEVDDFDEISIGLDDIDDYDDDDDEEDDELDEDDFGDENEEDEELDELLDEENDVHDSSNGDVIESLRNQGILSFDGETVTILPPKKQTKSVLDAKALAKDLLSKLTDGKSDDSASLSSNDKLSISSNDPNSFSRITPDELHNQTPEVLSKYPLLANAIQCRIDLKPGEMLYLPAGWFHEVRSFNEEGQIGHMAFNYWMHPPSKPAFENPYEDDYLESQWKDMKAAIDEMQSAVKTGKRIGAALGVPIDGEDSEEAAGFRPTKRRKH